MRSEYEGIARDNRLDAKIQKSYEERLKKIVATDEFKQQVKAVTMKEESSRVKRQNVRKTMFAMAACFVMVISIINGNKIMAAVKGMYFQMYQMFNQTVDEQFDINASGYEINVNKTFDIYTRLGMKIKTMVVTDEGIDIKYEPYDKKEKSVSDITICSAQVECEKQYFRLTQEMCCRTEKGYLVSLVLDDSDNQTKKRWMEIKNNQIKLKLEIDNFGEEEEFLDVQEIDMELSVKDIYHIKYYDFSKNDVRVNSLRLDYIKKYLWFMKVDYSTEDEELYEKLPALIFENKSELLYLGGESGYADEESKESPKYQLTEYLELKNDATNFDVYSAVINRESLGEDLFIKDKNGLKIDISSYEVREEK